jgi:hypothetical protein
MPNKKNGSRRTPPHIKQSHSNTCDIWRSAHTSANLRISKMRALKRAIHEPNTHTGAPAHSPLLTLKRAVLGTPIGLVLVLFFHSKLTTPPHSSGLPYFLQLYYITNTFLSSQQLQHPHVNQIQSPWRWRQYITPKPQTTRAETPKMTNNCSYN